MIFHPFIQEYSKKFGLDSIKNRIETAYLCVTIVSPI
jgi:hypothetical protein